MVKLSVRRALVIPLFSILLKGPPPERPVKGRSLNLLFLSRRTSSIFFSSFRNYRRIAPSLGATSK
jgi:hypothetical protein